MRILFLTLALVARAALAQPAGLAQPADLARPGNPAPPADAASAPGDPLRSVECRRALDALQVQEAAAAAAVPASGNAEARRSRAPDARLGDARKHAAAVCLRSRDDPPPPRRPLAQTPISVLPPPTPRVMQALPPSREPPPAVARPAERPRFITTCDAIGCWADDGSRLDRVGPDLRGPRGLCTVQGTLLTCP